MADGNSLYGVFVAAVGRIYEAIRGKKAQAKPIEVAGESSLEGFKALIKSGKTDELATNETIDPRFKAHYDQYIRPLAEAFEAKRVKTLGAFRKRMMIVIPLAAIVLVLVLMISKPGSPVAGIVGWLVFALGIWAFWPVWQYKSSIRQSIFPDIFRFYGAQWHYDPNGIGGDYDLSNLVRGNALDAFKELKRIAQGQPTASQSKSKAPGFMEPYMAYGILPRHYSASTKNFLSGDYKSVPITLVQCTLSSRYNSDDGSNIRFSGLLITIDVPKHFTGHTTVRRDYGKVANWFGKQFSSTLKPVKLEDPRFEKRYEVYSSDQVEARYLLTNTFMERLVALEDLFASTNGGRCNIQCAFKEGKLLFTIPDIKEWFATGSIFKPATFIGDINLILKQMDQLFAIVDVLQLDDKTGL